MSVRRIERSWMCLELTAPLRICFGPTLLRGTLNAAYDVPPIARTSAVVAATFAYVRRCRNHSIIHPSSRSGESEVQHGSELVSRALEPARGARLRRHRDTS